MPAAACDAGLRRAAGATLGKAASEGGRARRPVVASAALGAFLPNRNQNGTRTNYGLALAPLYFRPEPGYNCRK